jgi:hypothetical protein
MKMKSSLIGGWEDKGNSRMLKPVSFSWIDWASSLIAKLNFVSSSYFQFDKAVFSIIRLKAGS